jgi:hypothetical protein
MFLRPNVLGFFDLLFDSMPSERVCTTFGRELFAFSARYTLLFACSIMLCCVRLLLDFSRDIDILYTSFLIPGISFDFPYSLMF